jgi:hypothetical protein
VPCVLTRTVRELADDMSRIGRPLGVGDAGLGPSDRAVAGRVLRLKLYVSNLGDYTATYGAIGDAIVTMLWFYVAPTGSLGIPRG